MFSEVRWPYFKHKAEQILYNNSFVSQRKSSSGFRMNLSGIKKVATFFSRRTKRVIIKYNRCFGLEINTPFIIMLLHIVLHR